MVYSFVVPANGGLLRAVDVAAVLANKHSIRLMHIRLTSSVIRARTDNNTVFWFLIPLQSKSPSSARKVIE